MASNFTIDRHRKKDRLELELAGDFDGTSACELLNTLADNCSGIRRVLVDTTRLQEVYPFGRETFCRSLHNLKHLPIRLVFAGEKASRIAPKKNRFF